MAVRGGLSMGELRERMKRDMEIRGFSPHTQLVYLRRVAALTRYLGRSPDRVGLDEIQRYQLYLTQERKVAGGTFNQTVSALRFFYDPDQVDADGDGAGDACDCASADATLWALPSQVQELTLSQSGGTTTLGWTPPGDLGAISIAYDTLRSGAPDGFADAAVCIESNDAADTMAVDAELPAPGGVFHYLVRARNLCGTGPAGEGHEPLDCP
jgi:hypothetical protein